MTNALSIIENNYKHISEAVADAKIKYNRNDDVRIMAVTKTVPYELVNHAVSLGIDLLGENRVQEYLSKYENYTKMCEIHFIGGLQNNKVKYIIDKVSMIHSLDSIRLAEEISRRAVAKAMTMDVLVEVNIGNESTKGGIPSDTLEAFLADVSVLPALRVRGLMAIPPINCDEKCLGDMHDLFQRLKSQNSDFDTLSMGMSSDYSLAIKHGATIVRIGTALFGKR